MATNSSIIRSAHFDRQLRKFTVVSLMTLFALIVLSVYLLPFAQHGDGLAARSGRALPDPGFIDLPMMPVTFNYEGEDYPVYEVPIDDGSQAARADQGHPSQQPVR